MIALLIYLIYFNLFNLHVLYIERDIFSKLVRMIFLVCSTFQEHSQIKKSNRKRQITWYNPPRKSNFKTNLEGKFLGTITKMPSVRQPTTQTHTKTKLLLHATGFVPAFE